MASSPGRAVLSPTKDMVIMTPIVQGPTEHVIRVERYSTLLSEGRAPKDVLHIAGGQHTGIIIRKQSGEEDGRKLSQEPGHLQLEFKVYLVESSEEDGSGAHKKETRQIRFWFHSHVSTTEQHNVTQEFFKNLLSAFPKDYVGFIKRVLKLMHEGFEPLRKVEMVMRLLEEVEAVPLTMDYTETGGEIESVTAAHVQEVLEGAFPNGLSVEAIAGALRCSEREVCDYLLELLEKGIAAELDSGQWIRVEASGDTAEAMTREIPKATRTDQPTVAIITALFVEKLAVDAMIENKRTYMRYKTDGESNIYTLGNIGAHRVVATKLSAIGHTRAAMTAAGSITTRLLGGFQAIEHVFVVGVGGGVPHYTDKKRHVRLGDVVVSAPYSQKDNFAYIYCDKIERSRESGEVLGYAVTKWTQKDTIGPAVLSQILEQTGLWNGGSCGENGLSGESSRKAALPWEPYVEAAMEGLTAATASSEYSFQRPPPDSDVLTLPLGGGDVATVDHPDARDQPKVHLGPVGAGRAVLREPALRAEFAHQYHVKAFDGDFDSVVESVYGNRIDSWALVRGVADYGDGMRNKEWQAYAALQAAALTKLLIAHLPAD